MTANFQIQKLEKTNFLLQKLHTVQDNYFLIIFESPSFDFTIDFEKHQIQSPCLLVIKAGQSIQTNVPFKNMKGYAISFNQPFVDLVLDTFLLEIMLNNYLSAIYFKPSKTELKTLELQLATIEEKNHPSIDLLIKRHLLTVTMLKLTQRKYKLYQLLKADHINTFLKLEQLIEKHICSEKSVAFYADQLEYTSKTLNNICHKFVNMSAKALLINRLLVKINRMLSVSSNTIASVSKKAGFAEPTNFVKFYKQHTGMLPSDFRSFT